MPSLNLRFFRFSSPSNFCSSCRFGLLVFERGIHASTGQLMAYICNKHPVLEWSFHCFVFDIHKMAVLSCVFCYDKGNNSNLGTWTAKKAKHNILCYSQQSIWYRQYLYKMDLNVLSIINSIYKGHAVYSFTKILRLYSHAVIYESNQVFRFLFFFLVNFIQFLRAIKPIYLWTTLSCIITIEKNIFCQMKIKMNKIIK